LGTTTNGFVLPLACMHDPLARTLLSTAAFAIFALAVGLFSSAALRWELITAGVLGLLVCNFGYPILPPRRTLRTPDAPVLEREIARSDAFAPSPQPQRGVGVQRRPAGSFPRALPEGLPVSNGVAVLDREYRIVWCNDVAAAHFGIDEQNDIGRPIATLVRHPSLAAYLAAGNFSKSLRMQATDGDGPILAVQFVPYVASGWLLLSRNVARAARLEAMRRECIANVSHELRTPLTVMVGFLEAVRELKLDPGLSLDYLDRMEKQCGRMQRIIEELLQLSTLESAPQPPGDERVNIRSLLARIRTEAEALSGGRHRIELEAEAGFDLLGAESEFASAFGNLASNAIRYTEPGGTVRLVWRASPNGAEFAVEDTGVGIEKAHIPRLTERFYRVDRERSRHTGGTGLGLAIVKNALNRHQAGLDIESEPGKGSRFTARFPAHRVKAVTAPLESLHAAE
jgi:two-component system phosphate regulon sensor histidine kinase PhoR